MAAVDTNVLVRIITRDEPAQAEQAMHYVRSAGAEGVYVPPVVLAETVWVLQRAYRWKDSDVIKALQITANCGSFRMDDSCRNAIELYQRESMHGAGFADCLILQMVKDKHQGPLATFDRRLGALHGVHLL